MSIFSTVKKAINVGIEKALSLTVKNFETQILNLEKTIAKDIADLQKQLASKTIDANNIAVTKAKILAMKNVVNPVISQPIVNQPVNPPQPVNTPIA
jgi:hypothetical protein